MKNSDIRREQPKKRSTFKKVLVFLFVICFIAAAGAAAGFFVCALPICGRKHHAKCILAHL